VNRFNVVYQDFITTHVCMKVVVRSAVTGPDSSQILMCQHTKVPCCRYPVTL